MRESGVFLRRSRKKNTAPLFIEKVRLFLIVFGGITGALAAAADGHAA